MPEPKYFQAILVKADKSTATTLTIPFDVQADWNLKGRVPVRATLNGYPIRSSIFSYGGGSYFLVVNQEMREGSGLKAGDTVDVVMEVDLDPRIVQIPPDLRDAFTRNPQAEVYWDTLSYTHRREYVRYIEEPKRPETRLRRLEKTVVMLLDRIKEPR
jgi:hypothetical protein